MEYSSNQLTSASKSASKFRRENSRKGFALVLVLGALVLISILVISFYLAVKFNLTSTTAYANGGNARALSQDVIQLVESQITDATTAPVDINGVAHSYPTSPFSWASQPGMIRTYDTTGKGIMFYKLYSSDSMRTVWQSTGYQSIASMKDDLKLSDIADSAQFTDLNSPVINSAGNAVYPIVDPAALTGSNAVQGFSVSGAPSTVAGDATTNTLPMPVRWLYLLQNGSLVAAPSGGTSGTVNLSASGANATNPIVGRVAFWTDDETCKVNINTAAEGTYWDTPRFMGTSQSTITGPAPSPALTTTPYPDSEYALAVSQPVQYEFARYPGHPAQVAISPIFPNLLTQYTTPSSLAAAMAGITPFMASGGSQGGTQAIGTSSTIDLSTAGRKSPYASVDEFLYGTGLLSSSQRPTTDTSGNVVNQASLQSSKFFITANSRAPELNLFGEPRIACWPINNDLASNPSSPYTSVYDRLIAFCSSFQTVVSSVTTRVAYYFQRKEPNDPTYDYSNISRNQALYTYLQGLTSQAIPGFGGNFSTKYPSDQNQILTEIFDYIRCTNLCDPSLEASGNQYAVTMPANSTNNGAILTLPVTPIQIGATMGFGRTMVINQVGICLVCTGDSTHGDPATNPTVSPALQDAGQPVAPLSATQRVYQAAFLLQGYQTAYGPADMTPLAFLSVLGLSNIQFTTSGGAGFGSVNPFHETTTANPFNVSFFYGYQSGLTTGVVGAPDYGPVIFMNGHNGNNSLGTFQRFMPSSATDTYAYTAPAMPATGTPFYYPCISRPFLAYSTAPKVSVALTNATNGGKITVNMLPGPTSSGRLINPPTSDTTTYGTSPYQTITFGFPTTDITGAALSPSTMGLPAPTVDTANLTGPDYGFAQRVQIPEPGGSIWNSSDCVKSFFLAKHGDWRLIAASKSFVADPAPCYFNGSGAGSTYYTNATAIHFFHHFKDGNQYLYTNQANDFGSLVSPALLYPQPPNTTAGNTICSPLVPWDNIGSAQAPPVTSPLINCYKNGDFDNLIANLPDGPTINKPDEGDSGAAGRTQAPYFDGLGNDTVANGGTYFTPNRIMPSSGMFGSLPTGVKSNTPWQTLLFRPQPAINASTQSGNYYAHSERGLPDLANNSNNYFRLYTSPPDHLFMDLFWMPVVEPYAISDTFSTAGKINMNYQMQPFTYIDRNTSLVCLLKSEKLIAVPDAYSTFYKGNQEQASPKGNYRFSINPSESGGTLRQFASRFSGGDIFRSASEICDIFLVPAQDETGVVSGWASDTVAAAWWAVHRLTGDNSRERPYTNLYGRLTTKSNTFTIHMRVQSLNQSPADRSAGVWSSGQDAFVSEYRGSVLVERYLDPSGNYTDYAAGTTATALAPSANLDSSYKFRVVRTTQFAP